MDFTTLQQQWGLATLDLARSQGIQARIVKAFRSAQVLTYALRLKDATDLPKLARLEEPVALRLGTDSVRVGRLQGVVLVEVALPAGLHHTIPLSSLQPATGLAAVLGESVVKQPVALDLASPTSPHVLVAGTTGSGKTVLLVSWLLQLCRQNTPDKLRLLVLDGKGDLSAPFSRVPHLLHPVADSPGEFQALLAWCLAELDHRKHHGWHFQVLLVVDELAEVVQSCGGPDGPAAEALRRLAAQGRSKGIGLVLATQHPVATVIGHTLTRNLPGRLCGKVTDAAASSLVLGVTGASAHRLRGKGDFLLVAGQEPSRLQVALPSKQDLARLPRTDHVDTLDLDQLTMEGAMAATSGQDPLEPSQVAYAMASGRGIQHVRSHFAVGTKKATRVVDFARQLQAELEAVGCHLDCEAHNE